MEDDYFSITSILADNHVSCDRLVCQSATDVTDAISAYALGIENVVHFCA